MTLKVSVPYKIHLAGGYTVLLGGAAICLAIEPRFELCDIEENTCDELAALTTGNPFVREVFRDYPAGEAREIVARISVRDSLHGRGVGSSAALTVALVAARAQLAGERLGKDELFARARAIHRKAQGGRGSGCDIAACVYGGALIITDAAGDRLPQVRRTDWPAGLGICLAHSGEETTTVAAIDRFQASYAEARDSRAAQLLDAEVLALAQAFGQQQSFSVFEGLRKLLAAEQLFEKAYRLNLFGKSWQGANDCLSVSPARENCICLPQGAGGDDAAVLIYRRDELTFSDLEPIFKKTLELVDIGIASVGPVIGD